MFKPRFAAVATMVIAAIAARLIPHPWNFTPLAGVALFSGAFISNRKLALAVPLAAMALSDLILGLHVTLPFVYASLLLIVLIGRRLSERRDVASVGASAIASSVLFFLITNFGYWLFQPAFPRTPAGLMACYVAAIPFFQNTLIGDVFFTAFLFGGVHLATRAFPVLREPCKSI